MLGSGEKPGRGKRVTREQQRLPLIVSAARSRVNQNVVMSAHTARELRSYVKWAADATGFTEAETMVLALDKALGDLLKKDEVWQAAREKGRESPDQKEDESGEDTGEHPVARAPVGSPLASKLGDGAAAPTPFTARSGG